MGHMATTLPKWSYVVNLQGDSAGGSDQNNVTTKGSMQVVPKVYHKVQILLIFLQVNVLLQITLNRSTER